MAPALDPDAADEELRRAIAEGVLSQGEAEALRQEALRLSCSPLLLLREKGRISPQTYLSLCQRPSPAVGALDDTAQPGQASPPQGAAVFPAAARERYEPISLLGQGGMGTVFLARDRKLLRQVAVKFVRRDTPEIMGRLVSEARAQARVKHERVCEVYEVGEVAGEVYIAMQYIEGKSLHALAAELSVEERALVLREAALGISAAHRAGVIHRDIKPSNIMVARSESGALLPYVMDFGLARDDTSGATQTGAVLGSPQYMSPEQARGEVSRLDRRTDVYSLGATLYYVLCGEPPITASNALEVLSLIATAEPRRPRAINPDLPADLEAIALKCLEKDRSARYDSARALAEDLDRFLAGEPVLARAAGLAYRLRKRLRKHARAVLLSSVALLAILAATSYGALARRDVAARERLARRFTEAVERIEPIARYSALSPLHDTRPDLATIRAKMSALAADIAQAGPLAAGPGQYALGRGALALGDEAQARERLEAAWRRGYREPRVAYALALVLGRLYQTRLAEAERIRDQAVREARKRQIERQYRDVALAYLRQSEGADVPSRRYVAALIAFYEERFEQALAELDAITDLPWFYEAPALRGRVLTTRAWRRWNAGHRAEAQADFEAGRGAYHRATAIGQSVPRLYLDQGELEYSAMLMELYSSGAAVEPRFASGAAAVQRALKAQPDHYESLVLDARLHRRLAEHRISKGGEPDALLAHAIGAVERAIQLDPERPLARLELLRGHYQRGDLLQERNQDPSPELKQAIAAFERIAPADRDYDAYLYRGLVSQTWAEYLARSNRDARAQLGQAIDAFVETTRIDERQAPAWINLGTTYFTRASARGSQDVEGDCERARAALEKARALNPEHYMSYASGGQVLTFLAKSRRARGGDPRPVLKAALDLYNQGIAINPSSTHLRNGAGAVLLAQARAAFEHDEAPEPLFAQAAAAFAAAISAAPEQGFGYYNVGELWAQRARYERARGRDPRTALAQGSAALQQAIARLPGYSAPRSLQARLVALEAELTLEGGRDPGALVERGLALVAEALARDPRSDAAYVCQGELLSIKARARARRGQATAQDFQLAQAAFDQALALAAEEQDHALARARFLGFFAEWQAARGEDPGPTLTRGLADVEPVLLLRPTWAEALGVRARLLLLREGRTKASAAR